jgi:hypothetical protein
MEPRGCNWWQSVANQIGAEAAQTSESVAAGCHRLPEKFHGNEGVDGSSPSEGSAEAQHNAALSFQIDLQVVERGAGMEPLWSLQVENAVVESRWFPWTGRFDAG